MLARPIHSLALPLATSSKLSQAGFTTVDDLRSTSAESLAEELKVSLQEAETILLSCRKSTTPALVFSSTQSAASLASNNQKFSTRSTVVDCLLSGGLSRGHLLEVSGPPGTPKEIVAINLVISFVEADHEVIFIDCQNMTSPDTLNKVLQTTPDAPSDYSRLIYHVNVQALADLMVLIHHLPSILNSHQKVALLVLNSVSFPFQGARNLTVSAKTALLDKIKKALITASVNHNVTVVTTSQLSTKILNADGSLGTFDTGAKGVMVPQLGEGYISSAKTHRIIFAATGEKSGFVKLISSPKYPLGRGPSFSYEITKDGDIIKQ